MIKLSVKGLADFMTANDKKRRKILYDYKHPDDPESKAKILYYQEARDLIHSYHKQASYLGWLEEQSQHLTRRANLADGKTQTRLRNNARALRQYEANFGSRNFEVLHPKTFKLEFSDVSISTWPDLYVIERGRERLIKLEFSNKEPQQRVIKIITQCMFEASSAASPYVKSADVMFFDVPRGKDYKGARIGARLLGDIKAACETISDIWEKI